MQGIWERLATRPADGGDVWEPLRARADPARYRPRLASDVEIKRFTLRWGNDYAMAANPRDLVHYRLSPEEADLLERMDGSHSVEQLVAEQLEQTGDLDVAAVTELIDQLREGGFLDEPSADVYAGARRALHPRSRLRARAWAFLTTLSIDWHGADRFVRFLYRAGLRFAFTRAAQVIFILLAVAGLVAFTALVAPGRYELEPAVPGIEFAVIWTLNVLITFCHELGHAAVVIHHRRRVKSAGFRIYYGAPAFFVDSADALMMERRQRIMQAWAGPYVELILAAPAAILVWAMPDAGFSDTLYKWVVLNYFVVGMNLVPMLELDGYWIASDAIQVPDLRQRSLAFLRYDFWQKLRGRAPFTRSDLGIGAYGVAGLAFTVFMLYLSYFFWERLFLSVILAMWDGGGGGRALLALLVLFVAGPIVRGAIKLTRALGREIARFAHRARFRLQRGWRVEAASMLRDLPTVSEIPIETLNDFAGRVRLRPVSAGEPVVRQGERADAFYLVRRGSFEVLEEHQETGRARIVRRVGRGGSFGEMGLLEGAPRNATVRALTRGQVFKVDASAFQRLIAGAIEARQIEPTLQQLSELRELPAFAHLDLDGLARVLRHGAWVNLEPGGVLVVQGEAADAYWAIGSGRVEVLRDGERVAVRGRGEHIGEVGLLSGQPRNATARALTPVRAFRLDGDGFEALVREAFRRGVVRPNQQIDHRLEH